MSSPLDSWHVLFLTNTRKGFTESLETLVLKIADRFDELEANGTRILWHYRYGGRNLSIRARVLNGNERRLTEELARLAAEIFDGGTRRLVTELPRFEDDKWYKNWDAVLSAHKTRERWELWMETLHHLTKAIVALMRANIEYWKGVHHLFNMIGYQDMGGPYCFPPDHNEDVRKCLGEDQYNHLLKYALKIYGGKTEKAFSTFPLCAALIHPRLRESEGALTLVVRSSDVATLDNDSESTKSSTHY